MFLHLLKFNQNHDAIGRFATAGIGGADFNDHDRKIIDLKPDTRPLTDPKAVRLLSHILPGSTYVPYTRIPFFNAMMKMQGTNIETSTGKEQKAARNALLEQQPVGRVRISDLTFTQNVVHSQTVTDFKKKGGAPIQVARYKGKLYLLDGHHRVAKVALDGGKMLPAYILDMDKVHKFNPNHDELGRFATSPGTGQGVAFVSPNVREGLQVPDAVGAIGSSRHREVMAISAEVDALLGLRSKHESGVGAWSDGAEDTMLGRIYGNPTYDQVRLSAAMKGMLADQKAVIPFKVDRNGPDSLYKIKVSATDMAQVHETFLKAGLEFHTLVPKGDHTDVYVFDPGTELKQKVQEAGARHGTELSQWRGHGEFLGSWDTRQEGRQAYQAVIDAHLGPDRRGAWDRLHSRWRKTNPVLKGGVMYLAILKRDIDGTQLRDANGRWMVMGGGLVSLPGMSEENRKQAERAFRSTNPMTVAGQYSGALRNNDLLTKTMERLNDTRTGVRAFMGPMKARERADQKIAEKNYRNAGSLTDIVRSTIEVTNVSQVQEVVQRLSEHMPTMFEGIATTPLGYADAKALVRFPNGQIGEVQIIEPNFYEAKFKGYPNLGLRPGHEIYYEQRRLSKEDKKGDKGYQMYLESVAVYAEAMRRAARDWQNFIRRGSAVLHKADTMTGTETKVLVLNGNLTVLKVDHDAKSLGAWSLVGGSWVEADTVDAATNGRMVSPDSLKGTPPLPV